MDEMMLTQNEVQDAEDLRNIRLLGYGHKIEHQSVHIMAVFRVPVWSEFAVLQRLPAASGDCAEGRRLHR